MGADGSIFAVRRELYPDFPDTVQDDFTVSMSAVFAGRRLVRRGGRAGLRDPGVVLEQGVPPQGQDRCAGMPARTCTCTRQHEASSVSVWTATSTCRTSCCAGTRPPSSASAPSPSQSLVGGQFGLLVLGLVAVGAGLLVGLTGGWCAPGLVRQAKELLLALDRDELGCWRALRGADVRHLAAASPLSARRPRRGGPPRIDVRDAWMATSDRGEDQGVEGHVRGEHLEHALDEEGRDGDQGELGPG